MFTDICLFSSSLHQSYFTVIFHLRLPLILKWKPKHSQGWALLKEPHPRHLNTIKTQGGGVLGGGCWEQDPTLPLDAPGVIPSTWPVQKLLGEALFRELILTPNPPEKGCAGTGNGGKHCSEGSRRHTFCKRIPKINPNQKKKTKQNPTQGMTEANQKEP